MDKNVTNMINDLHSFLIKNITTDYFSVIYGSYAYGISNKKSDLDFVVACQEPNQNNICDLMDFAFTLYSKYHLAIDAEVPHRKKLLVSYPLVEKAIQGQGFTKKNDQMYVPQIIKNKECLESDSILMRLLFNILTTKNVFVSGNEQKYAFFRKQAIENLIGFIFTINDISSSTIDEFIQNLLGTPDRNGEMYLGYKNKPAVVSYLRDVVQNELTKLCDRDIFTEHNKRYTLKDILWLKKVICHVKE